MASLRELKALKTDKLKRLHTFTHRPVPVVELNCTTTDNGRWYTRPGSDEKLYSITTMLSKTSDDEWLKEWQDAVGIEQARIEVKRACDRGEAVHESCEFYLDNEPMEKVYARSGGYGYLFDQIKLHLDKHIGLVICQEIPLNSKVMRLAGRVDLIAFWKGELCIIDFKTSNAYKDRTKTEDYGIQLAAYSQCFFEMYGIRIKRFVNIIACEQRNEANLIEYTWDEMAKPLAERVTKFHKLMKSY